MNTDDALAFGPRQYAYELRQGIWCLGVFDNEHNGAVIGAANMRHHEVVFDRGSRRVGFFPSDCAEMHANRRSSILSGGYALNGCAKGTTSAAPAPAAPATALAPAALALALALTLALALALAPAAAALTGSRSARLDAFALAGVPPPASNPPATLAVALTPEPPEPPAA